MKITEVAEWFWIAEEDIKSAELLNKDKSLSKSNIYYHYSQAVEKYLKGYLVSNDKEYNKDHNLSNAIIKCIACDANFNDIENDCYKMSALYKSLRYPGRVIPTEKDIKFAFDLTEKIKQLKPIQELYNKINNELGVNWRNTLFLLSV